MYSLARIKGNEKREAPKKCLFSGLSGAPYWIRTSGLTLRRRALYPAELMALIWGCGAQGECTSSRLGGGRSIQLSYSDVLSSMIIARRKSNCNPLFNFSPVAVVT